MIVRSGVQELIHDFVVVLFIIGQHSMSVILWLQERNVA